MNIEKPLSQPKAHGELQETEVLGGVPIGEILSHAPGKFKVDGSMSGRKLTCWIDDSLISIVDKSETELDLEFGVTAVLVDDLLKLGVQTRGWENDLEKPHPDLFAAKLVKRIYKHFIDAGKKISRIQGSWYKSVPGRVSVNNDQFFLSLEKNRKDYPHLSELERQQQAAGTTWTGKLAVELGFSEVKVESVDQGAAFVVFQKHEPEL